MYSVRMYSHQTQWFYTAGKLQTDLDKEKFPFLLLQTVYLNNNNSTNKESMTSQPCLHAPI